MMATFTHPNPPATFSVPDQITVRQQLAYFSEAAGARGKEWIERLWAGALTLIQDWKSEALPDPRVDLDATTDPAHTSLIIWAAFRVKAHVDALETVPKAS